MPLAGVRTATYDSPLPGPTGEQVAAAERTADARLARVHLRGGLLALARAALEQMAGAGTLDRDAMADLAEVLWRSGDLEGAADAARAHQASGGSEPLAALIIAEGLARSGQEAQARTLAERVDRSVGGAIDILFAMEPRSSAWAPADDGWMPTDAEAPGHWGLLVGGSEVAAPRPGTWQLAPLDLPVDAPEVPPATGTTIPFGRGVPGQPGGAGTTTTSALVSGRLAGNELESVDRSLAAGDAMAAAQRLAVLLRLDPALAPVILSAADRAASVPSVRGSDLSVIHLVRGDAYRILGRDNEAAEAYRQAHLALGGGSPPAEEPT